MIGSELLRYSDKKIVLFDLETQRVNIMGDNLPFQCSWIVCDKYKVLSRNNYYLKWPGFTMSKGAAAITRFQQSWVDNGDDPEFVLKAFESYLMDPSFLIVGHNLLGFDIYVHQLWRETLGLKRDFSYLSRIIDTNLIARAYKMGWKPDKTDFLAWQYKVMSNPVKGVKTNLAQLNKDFQIGVNESNLHNAAADLELNFAVYRKLIGLVEV